ncbi:hypothetical protein BD410DRAFT_787029 [Rickenella mellea]|uniref:Uncharacterized protein n=1 Tax=Rickenella mellea TaxID=50990 RepID=A0A4Y7Q7X4_9AGAM|nr:hypothetical protein BD410DRAFT_787029 [Rickenella mellea]
MPFSFSFSLHVPGLINPFSSFSSSVAPRSEAMVSPVADTSESVPSYRRRPSPSPASSIAQLPPLSKKRGWAPASAEASEPTTMTASTSGYLDTPAKYREMAAQQQQQQDDADNEDTVIVDLPPAKRRRGLAGSVISTAFSAALIGTAVGLTVYRLWRDRGNLKEIEQPPPPPYQEDWVDARAQIQEVPAPKSTPVSPRGRRSRPTSVARRPAVGRHRRTHTRTHGVSSHENSPFFSAQSRFELAPSAEVNGQGGEVEDQMDWIGGKLAQLIEEGKRALGKEVVVKCDAPEDEVDDGDSGWVEEDDGSIPVPGPSKPFHRSRPNNIHVSRSPAYSGYNSVPSTSPPVAKRFRSPIMDSPYDSPQNRGYGGWSSASVPTTPMPTPYARCASVESDAHTYQSLSLNGSPKETENDWQSQQIRESMEKARAALLQRRAGTLGAYSPG